jgi:hypothetical protein
VIYRRDHPLRAGFSVHPVPIGLARCLIFSTMARTSSGSSSEGGGRCGSVPTMSKKSGSSGGFGVSTEFIFISS